MKRFLSIFTALLILSGTVLTAQEQGDEYDDGYVYKTNGTGDNFLKFSLGALFPLNFDGHLYTGGIADVGYYRFLNGWFAVGGEFSATYNLSIGNKTLVMLPITAGVMLQPAIGNFEFPVYLNVGMAYETWQNMNFFPSLVLKGSAGFFYRLNDILSLGTYSTYIFIPQNDMTGNFLTASVGLRYHF
ncbi:MAG: hypothetical protein K5829_14105 [Treponema sp.]|nr:hypothetical protein [Treponema sp.]